MLDPRLLAFFAIADSGQLSIAAERLGRTQPAVSKLLKRLEQDIGAKLFERHPRGVTLTEAGEILLRQGRRAALALAFAKEEVVALSSNSLQEMRIACGPIYLSEWVYEPMQRLMEKNPTLTLTLEASSVQSAMPRLMRGEIDAYFGHVDPNGVDGDLDYTHLMNVETVILAAQDHPLANRPRLSLPELAGATWIYFLGAQKTNERLEQAMLRANGALPPVRFKTSSFRTAVAMVGSSRNLLCVPSAILPLIQHSGLTVVDTDTDIWKYETGCLIRKSAARYEAMRQLVDMLRVVFSASPLQSGAAAQALAAAGPGFRLPDDIP